MSEDPHPTGPVRLRATWIVEYDAHHDDYATEGTPITPAEMAKMDEACDDCVSLMADGSHISFVVAPVGTQSKS